MSVGIFVRRFKDVFLQIIEKHHVNADHIVGIRHMKSFGFGNQSGLSCSRQFRHHDKLLADSDGFQGYFLFRSYR